MLSKSRKNKKRVSVKNIFFSIGLGIFFLAVIIFLGVTNWRINQRRIQLASQLEAIKKEVEAAEQKNQKLKSEAAQVGTQDYIEKVAREQLNLKAPGEEVVIVSGDGEQKPEESVEQERKFWDPRGWWEWIKSKF